MRIALSVNLGDFPVDHEIEANTRLAATALRDQGAIVDEVELPWTLKELSETIVWTHFGAIFGSMISDLAEADQELLMPYTRDFARRAAEGIGALSFVRRAGSRR